MSLQSFILVGAGGALGSMGRYGFGAWVGRVAPGSFPLGTLLINIAGSLVMGLVIGVLARTAPAWQAEGRLFVAVGILGGFTTFSAFSLDAITLIERGELWQAALYVSLSVAVSIIALFLGLYLTRLGV